MADTYTTNLNLTKPEVGASTDTWGTKLNADLDTLDAIFSASGTAINLGNVTVASLTTTGDINFGDNDKAVFGAGSDLQIYHDGSNSRIQEGGTGSLLVRGTNLQLQDSDGYDYLTCTDGGNGGTVALKHLGTTVLNTNTDGITVTGTVNSMTIAASGFTCPTNQNFIINSPNGLRMNIDSNNTGTVENFTIGHNEATTGSNILFRIGEAGKASIGHGAANANLHIGDANATGDTTNPALQIGGSSTYRLGMYTSTEGAVIENKNGDDGIQFKVKTVGEAMRIDGGTGNVGIGTIPSSKLHVKSSNRDMVLVHRDSSNGDAGIQFKNNSGNLTTLVSQALGDFVIDTAQNIILDGKKVGVGDQASSPNGILEVNDDSSDPIFVVHKNSTGVSDAVRIRHGRGLSGFNGKGISFRRNDDTEVGSVVIHFTSTVYNTSSDYRLKENVNYTWDATTRLKQLKPARFNFIEETGITVDGFLAHEVQDIVPLAVTGEKDAVDVDGNPDYQGIDHSKLVPLLVKTIQELEARITALET